MKSKRIFQFGSTSSATNAANAVAVDGNIGAAIGVGAGPTAMPAAGQLFNFTATPQQQQQMQVKNSTLVNFFLRSLFVIIVIENTVQ